MHHAYTATLSRPTLLAPEIVEAVLGSHLPKRVRLEDPMRPLPSGWAQQRALLSATGGPPTGTVEAAERG